MAIFDEAFQYIVDDTNRPDMIDAIKRRIQRAVLSMHRIDFWKKDFIEQRHAFQYTQAIQVINTDLYPRMRAIGYIRKFNPAMAAIPDPTFFGAAGDSFREINPQLMLDGYGYDKRNTMYRSGNTIKINSSENIQNVLIGWFPDPLLEPIEVCDSWILKDYPSLIAAQAKRRIFKDIGKDEEARSAEKEFQDELLLLQTNNIKLAVLQQ